MSAAGSMFSMMRAQRNSIEKEKRANAQQPVRKVSATGMGHSNLRKVSATSQPIRKVSQTGAIRKNSKIGAHPSMAYNFASQAGVMRKNSKTGMEAMRKITPNGPVTRKVSRSMAIQAASISQPPPITTPQSPSVFTTATNLFRLPFFTQRGQDGPQN